MEKVTLSSLKNGHSATIFAIGKKIQGQERRRLLDLGIIPGAQITHKLNSPSNETRAFEIHGSVIALRKEQTGQIFITEEGTD